MSLRRSMSTLAAVMAITVLWSHAAWPSYTNNQLSTVAWVKVYNSDVIYFQLTTQPTTACALTYFVLSPGLTADQRQRYYALLLTAKATGQQVSVGYGVQAVDCYDDKPLVYALSLHD